ncbi:MAG: TonB-dependent receptor [Acidobacteriales bacterium]|nr:TonB-dependent receptor [Terriglobales bacterium]
MVRSRVFLSAVFLLFVPAALAGELRVKVLDPHSAAVAGAQVSLYRRGESVPLQIRTSSGEGVATFDVDSPAPLRVEVLAPGFAAARADVEREPSTVTVPLQVAAASETVIVTATRTPTPEQETASSVSLLSGDQITTMQPVSFSDALRFLPGAVVNVAGQRGGLASLFVRGGDSRYNKVLVDGVPVDESGGTFDFGTVPLAEADRVEFQRGTQSTLYGSDAMTSVLQVFTRNGTTAVPELRFGADGGNFSTAHGYVSLAGARSRFDYNAFADQFQTNGQGPNADYFNALQGVNFGVQLHPRALLRIRTRHSNSRTGVPGIWDFNNQRLLPPDSDTRARQNNLLASAELTIAGPSRWVHHLMGFEYRHLRTNIDDFKDPGRVSPLYGNFDIPYHTLANINRAGLDYQGDYVERAWARTTIGYEFEDENGFVGDPTTPPQPHGSRLNHAAFVQQAITWKRLSAVAGVRFVHNETFGNKAVPRIALSAQVLRGGQFFAGTRLRFSFAQGIKEPRFEESLAGPPFSVSNDHLRAEENRAFEAGIEQSLLAGRFALAAIYYNNLFRDQIDYACCNDQFQGQYVNVNRSMAHGAEVTFTGRLTSRARVEGSYNYASTQILEAPFAFDPLIAAGRPLLRRPKHSGSLLVTYLGSRWGANLGGSFVGRRTDSDFLGLKIDGQFITHAAGYARVDLGGWYAINSRITAYANIENAFNNHYNEVLGYPALTANFRAGVRFRIGGE